MDTRTVLLNPGPVNLSPGIRKALTKPDLCHREVEFARLQSGIRSALLRAYDLPDTRYTSVVLSGSGTLAVEAMLCSLVPQDGKLLVLSNGVYGERMGRIAAAHGIPHALLRLPWGAELDPDAVELELQKDGQISHVAFVHHETTTGRLNELSAIGQLCRDRGNAILLDAVSSFGAEAIEFENASIAACAVSANKCLHGAPGVAFVVCRRPLLEEPAGTPRSLYMDLRTHWVEQEKDSCAFTPAVPLCYALAEALNELRDTGGPPARHDRYEGLATLVRDRMAELGVQRYLTSGPLASSLTAFHLPGETAYQDLHDRLREAGFVIYAGQGALSRKIFRIATMGEVSRQDLERLFEAFSRLRCELSF